MSNPVPSGENLTDAALDQWVADAEKTAAKYQQLSADVARVSVSESTPDGLITATVDSSGLLTDLRIADRAMNMPGARLAAGVLMAMRGAQSRIAGQVAEIMKAGAADDVALTEAVLSRYHNAFPPQPEPAGRQEAVEEARIGYDEAPPAPPPPAPTPARVRGPVRRPSAAPAQDWDGGDSFLEEVDR
jgi:DNA-binding protein YbaB